METVAAQLILYGPLGIMTLILLYAVIALYRAKERQAKEHQEALKALNDQHQRELSELMHRHVEKAEIWVEKGHELASNLQRVLESLLRKS